MLNANSIYIDTSAFYALIDRSDRFHESAKNLWPTLLGNDFDLYTSNYVVSETMNIMQHRLGFEAASLWQKAMLGVVDVQWVDRSGHSMGLELWLSLGREHCSFVDCVSYVTMNKLNIEQVFCFKASYAERGYIMVPGNTQSLINAKKAVGNGR